MEYHETSGSAGRSSALPSTSSSVGPDPAELGKDLLDAAFDGDQDRVQHLLQEGADLAFRDDEDLTALHHAVAGGHADMVTYLLDKGADQAALTEKGGTALHLAASEGHPMIIRELVWRGMKVNAADDLEATPLHAAVRAGQHAAAVELLKRGADPNVQDKQWQRSPLHVAVKESQAKIVEDLLKFKAKPNIQDSTGTSPLHEVVGNDDIKVAELLLDHGADVHLTDEMAKKSALDAAKSEEMRELLLRYKDRPAVYDEPEPPLSEVNPFKASLDMLKGNNDTASSHSLSDTLSRGTLPRDIKLTPTSSPRPTRIPSPVTSTSIKNSPLVKVKKLFTGKGGESPGQSPRMSRIPIDSKHKIISKADLTSFKSDPVRSRSMENLLDDGFDVPFQGRSPNVSRGVQKRAKDSEERTQFGGMLALYNRRSASQFTSLPKDMKYKVNAKPSKSEQSAIAKAMKTPQIPPTEHTGVVEPNRDVRLETKDVTDEAAIEADQVDIELEIDNENHDKNFNVQTKTAPNTQTKDSQAYGKDVDKHETMDSEDTTIGDNNGFNEKGIDVEGIDSSFQNKNRSFILAYDDTEVKRQKSKFLCCCFV